ncbi:hypothetical protein L917_09534 [Phytophthora nicotianae]|uniref:Uncharacterized protein n=2 Tax=Phytophthora nicotianae TaxID=4792 RepID=V9F1Z1_PHYNI|nr:hypothetical protein F443_09908 [Phytophthora nicotianae P1569]ETL92030.1 hypothetical protein L917_09534 [Phytophthora nicotianae]ETM45327.1 hypothetical protein L914_09575 [Phytophthora nicotianae]
MEHFRAMLDENGNDDDYLYDGSNYCASEQAEEAICVDGSSDDIPEDYVLALPTTKNISLLEVGEKSSELAASSS